MRPSRRNVLVRFAHTIALATALLSGSAGTPLAAEDDDASAAVREAPRVLSPAGAGIGRYVPDVELTDLDGKQVRLSDFDGNKALVIAMTGTSCPLCKKFAPTLARLEREYADRGVAFLLVNPIGADPVKLMRAAIAELKFRAPYIHETDEKLTSLLKAKTTTEVFVLDKARTLVYRGAVDDQYGLGYALAAPRRTYLVDALNAVLSGEQPRIAATTAPGCELWFEKPASDATAAPESVTWHRQVSRIVQQHCQECHREQGIAPFPLVTRDDVIAHAGMIRRVVEQQTMPPWFAAADAESKTTRWANDRTLPAGDKLALLAWLAGDRAEGDPAAAPLPRKFVSGWTIGEPDVVWQLPKPLAVQATGTMPYKHVQLDVDIDEDRWIQAVEIRPTAAEVVHHVLLLARGGKAGRRTDEASGFMAAYVPGNTWQRYPPDFAKRLPAGSKLIVQMHYTPVGKATEDQTRIGVIFAKQPPRHQVHNAGIANHRISIPPGASNHQETATQQVPHNARLLAFMPHMHLRGKAFRYELVSAGGLRQTLLDVPRYDFNWQLEYRLANPLPVAAGNRLEVTGWFDNSVENPANPDPSLTVKWGPQTYDEMLIGYIEYYLPDETPESSTQAGAEQGAEKKPAARLSETEAIAQIEKAFRRYDRNGDERVTAAELNQPALFEQIDTDKDGEITLPEAREFAVRVAKRKS